MLNKDVVIGVGLMSISAAFFIATWSFPIEGQYVSPRVFPRFVSACMIILTAILVGRNVRTLRRPAKTGDQAGDTDLAARARAFLARNGLIIAFAVIAFVYTQAISYVGFVVSTLLLLAVTVFLFNERRWFVIALVSVLGTSVFYYVFRIIFKVPLPRFDLF